MKLEHLDNYVHLRGLIEYSNVCTKYCLYCGVRCKNLKVERYTLSDEEVIECAKLAHELGYGSVALQSGERSDAAFVDKITYLVKEIKKIGDRYYIRGSNFTERSIISLNGKQLSTVYLSPTLLALNEAVDPDDIEKLEVSQVDKSEEEILTTVGANEEL